MINENSLGEPNADSEKESSRKSGIISQLRIILLLTVLVIIINVGFGFQLIKAPRGELTTKARVAVAVHPPKKSESCRRPTFIDCKDALRQGYTISGLYTIKPNVYTAAFQVYCDMLSGGGGWTLVASIHEDDIDKNCGSGDMWSRASKSPAFDNWFNLKSFGNLNDVTGEDYKNKAFYALNASDMMIWHVPNDIRLPAISDSAFFKYHTTNGFLQKYGSNLQMLFTEYFPLISNTPRDVATKMIRCVQKVRWSDIWKMSRNRGSRLDQVEMEHVDSMMFTFPKLNQTRNYRSFPENRYVFVRQKHSKTATTLFWIPVPNGLRKVVGKIYWGLLDKNLTTGEVETSSGDYIIRFAARCDGPYCKILFTVSNSVKWRRLSSTTSQQFRFSLVDKRKAVSVHIENMNRATMIGYTTFQRLYSTSPEVDDWNRVLNNLPECLDTVPTYMDLPSLSVPATFIKGKMDYNDSDVTPGFIELRKYDDFGYPYPMCPGMRLKSDADPALYCVGGLDGRDRRWWISRTRRPCGDFADWDQLAAHSVKRTNSSTGEDVTDLTSSLLLFYR